jgi:heme O synthase-like polyprenyltransferase
MTDATNQTQAAATQTGEAQMGDYYALMKPRVMQLVVFTALVGLLVAPTGVNPFIGFVAILCIAVGAGASGALNMWWDADIDSIMKRTANRPIPSGAVAPGEALGIGLGLSGLRLCCCSWQRTLWLLDCSLSRSFSTLWSIPCGSNAPRRRTLSSVAPRVRFLR